jgi:hypothetical protein
VRILIKRSSRFVIGLFALCRVFIEKTRKYPLSRINATLGKIERICATGVCTIRGQISLTKLKQVKGLAPFTAFALITSAGNADCNAVFKEY